MIEPGIYKDVMGSFPSGVTVITTLDDDGQIVGLIAQRGAYVSQAARFKKDSNAVKAPQRVEQVFLKVRALADELGANPQVTEQVYRAMIAAFIEQELAEHKTLAK